MKLFCERWELPDLLSPTTTTRHQAAADNNEEEDDYHDYTDIPDHPPPAPGSYASSGYHSYGSDHGNPLRDYSPFVSTGSLSSMDPMARRAPQPPPISSCPPSQQQFLTRLKTGILSGVFKVDDLSFDHLPPELQKEDNLT
eukprot:sb/3474217/